jgi:hypothetical protein
MSEHSHTVWVKRRDQQYCADCGAVLGEQNSDEPIFVEGLRDYLAGQALAGYLTNDRNVGGTYPDMARCVYNIADAMLAERSKP